MLLDHSLQLHEVQQLLHTKQTEWETWDCKNEKMKGAGAQLGVLHRQSRAAQ